MRFKIEDLERAINWAKGAGEDYIDMGATMSKDQYPILTSLSFVDNNRGVTVVIHPTVGSGIADYKPPFILVKKPL